MTIRNSVAVASEVTPIELPQTQPNFVETPAVANVIGRAMRYFQAGLPVHFSGPTGTGKTTLALHLAGQLGRPVILIHGDEEFSTSDLVGGEYGFKRSTGVDNYIKSVLKTQESLKVSWVDKGLTTACRHGYTFLYDEFTRARPEANNILLSVLEERILDLPIARETDGHMQVSPNFRAIFTSNPEEYAGVHPAQDALRDRMMTIKLRGYDRETEVAITQVKGGIPRSEAEKIVKIVRGFREANNVSTATVRESVMIAKALSVDGSQARADSESFVQACIDVLGAKTEDSGEFEQTVTDLILEHC